MGTTLSRKESILLILGFSEACLLLLSNFLASVIWGFDLPLFGDTFHFVQDGGILTFPFIYIITDLVVELYGRKIADRVATLTFWINAAALIFCLVASILPVIPDTGSEVAQQALSFSARISFASILAFYAAQLVNNRIFEWLKNHLRYPAFWKHSLYSSAIARVFDTVIFNLVAFLGRSPMSVLIEQIIWAIIVPLTLEACLNPLTKLCAVKLSAAAKEPRLAAKPETKQKADQ